jgi:hypothetical protein
MFVFFCVCSIERRIRFVRWTSCSIEGKLLSDLFMTLYLFAAIIAKKIKFVSQKIKYDSCCINDNDD